MSDESVQVVNLRSWLQEDLYNEVKHMMFYLNAASYVGGLHREEFREFFLDEAKEELGHIHEFADMIVYLGGSPLIGESSTNTASGMNFPSSGDPYALVKYAVDMEQEVANNYAKRLRDTHEMRCAAEATLHVFYEDQIKHSQVASWELSKWLKKFPVTVVEGFVAA